MAYRVGQILAGGRRITAQTRALFARGVMRASSFIPATLVEADATTPPDIPANAVYYNGEPVYYDGEVVTYEV